MYNFEVLEQLAQIASINLPDLGDYLRIKPVSNGYEIHFEKKSFKLTEFIDKIKSNKNELRKKCKNIDKCCADIEKISTHDKKTNPDSVSDGDSDNNDKINRFTKYICDQYPDIENLLNDKKTNLIVKGYVQGGKTLFELSMIWLSIFKWKKIPVFVLSNLLNSFAQVKDRDVPEFNDLIDEVLGGINSNIYITMTALSCGKNNDLNKGEFLVTLNNPSQLKKIENYVNFCDGKYNMIVDESDACVSDVKAKQISTKSGVIFDKLIDKSQLSFLVTATPFANLNKRENFSKSISLEKKSVYRGINEIITHYIPENLRSNNKIEELLSEIERCYNSAEKNPSGYKSVLVNASSQKKKHLISQRVNLDTIGLYDDKKIYLLPKECISNILFRLDWYSQCRFVVTNKTLYREFGDVRKAKLVCAKIVRKNLFRRLQEARSYIVIRNHLSSIGADFNPVIKYNIKTHQITRFNDRPYSERLRSTDIDYLNKVHAEAMIKSIQYWCLIDFNSWDSARSWLLVKCLACLRQPINRSCMLLFRSHMPKALNLSALLFDREPIKLFVNDSDIKKEHQRVREMVQGFNIHIPPISLHLPILGS